MQQGGAGSAANLGAEAVKGAAPIEALRSGTISPEEAGTMNWLAKWRAIGAAAELAFALAIAALSTPTASQTVTPVTPSQASPPPGVVTPVVPSQQSPSTARPRTPSRSGVVTPVAPGQAGSSGAPGGRIRAIAPAQLMWLHQDLRFRERPGLAGRIIGVVRARSAVRVVGEVVDPIDGLRWYEADINGKRGFIAGMELSTQPPR